MTPVWDIRSKRKNTWQVSKCMCAGLTVVASAALVFSSNKNVKKPRGTNIQLQPFRASQHFRERALLLHKHYLACCSHGNQLRMIIKTKFGGAYLKRPPQHWLVRSISAKLYSAGTVFWSDGNWEPTTGGRRWSRGMRNLFWRCVVAEYGQVSF